MSDLSRNAIKGIKWTSLAAFSCKLIQFGIGIVLARLLSPADFGIVGMTTIFLMLTCAVTEGGLSAALIRKRVLTEADKSTVFIFNTVVSFGVNVVLWLAAPAIASFLKAPVLSSIIRALAVSAFIGSFSCVYWALCARDCDFRRPALIDIVVKVIAGCVAVILAFRGYGLWALVAQSALSMIGKMILIWFVYPWRPQMVFSWRSFRDLFGFGWNLMVNSILEFLYTDGVGMLIGKFHTPAQLGFYSKGQNLARLPATFMIEVVGKVLLPVFSKAQDDDGRLIGAARKLMRALSLIVFFPMLLMVALARSITEILYTGKWLMAVPYLQIFCLTYMLHHINIITWNLLLAKGFSRAAMIKEIVNKLVGAVFIVIAISFGPLWIAMACLATTSFSLIVNVWVANRFVGYKANWQVWDFGRHFLCAIVAVVPAYVLEMVLESPYIATVGGGIVSSVLFLALMFLVSRDDLIYTIEVTPLKRYFGKLVPLTLQQGQIM